MWMWRRQESKGVGMVRVIVAMVCLFWAQVAQASVVTTELNGVKVAVWLPLELGRRASPLIIVSHGLQDCYATAFPRLAERIARRGYVVVAPNHQDGVCDENTEVMPVDANLFRPEEWKTSTYADRGEDVRKVFDGLKLSPDFASRIDFKRVGMVGMSLGGYTVIGIAQKRWDWRPEGLKAIVGISAHCAPYSSQKLMGKLTLPVLFEQGARDAISTPYVEELGGCYDQAGSPKYMVEFANAGHAPWIRQKKKGAVDLDSYLLAFLDTYVKGRNRQASLIKVNQGVSALWYSDRKGTDRYNSPTREEIKTAQKSQKEGKPPSKPKAAR